METYQQKDGSIAFKSYEDAFQVEAQERLDIKFGELCKYGIKPLDDAMLAIARNELIVIGAGSGYGKTELALAISRYNALNGKRVAHYNLEGGYREAIQRMKWRDMCDIYFNEPRAEYIELDYRTWVLNKEQNPTLIDIEARVYDNLKDKLAGKLYLYNNPLGLNCDEFCASLLDFHDLRVAFEQGGKAKKLGFNLDLIVIDHLHYFSLDKNEDEIGEITKILKEVKKITENYNIPVILVAHLRKLPRGHGVPDKEDIYGTSNIHKIANTCIILAPDHENDDTANGLYPTYIRIAKSRQGLRPHLLIYSKFDIKTRRYQDDYELYKSFPNGEVATEPLPDAEKPRWARKEKDEPAVKGDFGLRTSDD